MVAATHARNTGRNSSIELLRLVAMLMIVGFHFVWYSKPDRGWLTTQSITFKKIVYELIYGGGGWIGNFIFFTISVWFLCDRNVTLRSSLRRIWIMERELIFWSVSLCVICMLLRHNSYHVGESGNATMLVKSLLPLSMDLWWYPTSYAIFLALLPFLNIGTRSLGRRMHGVLAVVCLIMWGVLALIPKVKYNLSEGSVFVFIYWYILLTYYRWYMNELNKKQTWGLLAAGVIIEVLFLFMANALYEVIHKAPEMQFFLLAHWRLPTMMIGFAVFLLVSRTEFHSRAVNVVAASSFGIFLIHYNPYVFSFWTHYVPAERVFASKHALGLGALVIIGVFMICLLLDMVRQGLFRLTVDRRRGAWFDKLYAWSIRKLGGRLSGRLTHAGAIDDDSDLVD